MGLIILINIALFREYDRKQQGEAKSINLSKIDYKR
jgi:hypothetical protein